MAISGKHLIINPANMADAKIVAASFPDGDELAEGTCLLQIDGFAMTANNITYGQAPAALRYWEFFPYEDATYGRVPTWGFADVIASRHPDIAEGARVYGYLPMSTHLVIEPGQITPNGMMDMAEARQGKAPIYNNYSFCAADPMYAPDQESLISIFRPLFTTSFLLADFHDRNAFFGAEQVILSSASSKTSLGLAYALRQNGKPPVPVVGLTGTGNLSFVEGLGVYDQSVTYDRIESLTGDSACFVDMAGNSDVRRRLHTHFGDGMKGSTMVGVTHWGARGMGGGPLPGAAPEMFFAPTYAQDRIAEWGGAGFQQRLGAAWTGFIEKAQAWVTIRETRGDDAVMQGYQAMLVGNVPANVGQILRF